MFWDCLDLRLMVQCLLQRIFLVSGSGVFEGRMGLGYLISFLLVDSFAQRVKIGNPVQAGRFTALCRTNDNGATILSGS